MFDVFGWESAGLCTVTTYFLWCLGRSPPQRWSPTQQRWPVDFGRRRASPEGRRGIGLPEVVGDRKSLDNQAGRAASRFPARSALRGCRVERQNERRYPRRRFYPAARYFYLPGREAWTARRPCRGSSMSNRGECISPGRGHQLVPATNGGVEPCQPRVASDEQSLLPGGPRRRARRVRRDPIA